MTILYFRIIKFFKKQKPKKKPLFVRSSTGCPLKSAAQTATSGKAKQDPGRIAKLAHMLVGRKSIQNPNWNDGQHFFAIISWRYWNLTSREI